MGGISTPIGAGFGKSHPQLEQTHPLKAVSSRQIIFLFTASPYERFTSAILGLYPKSFDTPDASRGFTLICRIISPVPKPEYNHAM